MGAHTGVREILSASVINLPRCPVRPAGEGHWFTPRHKLNQLGSLEQTQDLERRVNNFLHQNRCCTGPNCVLSLDCRLHSGLDHRAYVRFHFSQKLEAISMQLGTE